MRKPHVMDRMLMEGNKRLTNELRDVVDMLRTLVDELYGMNPPPPHFEAARKLLLQYPEED